MFILTYFLNWRHTELKTRQIGHWALGIGYSPPASPAPSTPSSPSSPSSPSTPSSPHSLLPNDIIFLGNSNIGNLDAILVNLVVCVHININFWN
ncbi:MAG: hypothetical protein RMY29_005470 [Nostoc sp. CreGUA01]|nr:hypothetical protein [Nostoc sp. CreGUA01]